MSGLRNHFLRRLSPAMVLALVALVVALSGTATAAGLLVTSKQDKDGTIQTVDISKSAQAQLKRAEGDGVEGSWIVTVMRVNPPPNVPATFQVADDLRPRRRHDRNEQHGTTLRGPAHGSWERIDGRLYATTMVFFRFDPQTGAFAGTQKVNRTMRLSQDAQTFEAVSLVTQYDPDGVVTVSGLRATETANASGSSASQTSRSSPPEEGEAMLHRPSRLSLIATSTAMSLALLLTAATAALADRRPKASMPAGRPTRSPRRPSSSTPRPACSNTPRRDLRHRLPGGGAEQRALSLPLWLPATEQRAPVPDSLPTTTSSSPCRASRDTLASAGRPAALHVGLPTALPSSP